MVFLDHLGDTVPDSDIIRVPGISLPWDSIAEWMRPLGALDFVFYNLPYSVRVALHCLWITSTYFCHLHLAFLWEQQSRSDSVHPIDWRDEPSAALAGEVKELSQFTQLVGLIFWKQYPALSHTSFLKKIIFTYLRKRVRRVWAGGRREGEREAGTLCWAGSPTWGWSWPEVNEGSRFTYWATQVPLSLCFWREVAEK